MTFTSLTEKNPEDNVIYISSLKADSQEQIFLFSEYGGGNEPFNLYGRDKESGYLIPIGRFVQPETIDVSIRQKECAKRILKERETNGKLEGLVKGQQFILRQFGWSTTNHLSYED